MTQQRSSNEISSQTLCRGLSCIDRSSSNQISSQLLLYTCTEVYLQKKIKFLFIYFNRGHSKQRTRAEKLYLWWIQFEAVLEQRTLAEKLYLWWIQFEVVFEQRTLAEKLYLFEAVFEQRTPAENLYLWWIQFEAVFKQRTLAEKLYLWWNSIWSCFRTEDTCWEVVLVVNSKLKCFWFDWTEVIGKPPRLCHFEQRSPASRPNFAILNRGHRQWPGTLTLFNRGHRQAAPTLPFLTEVTGRPPQLCRFLTEVTGNLAPLCHFSQRSPAMAWHSEKQGIRYTAVARDWNVRVKGRGLAGWALLGCRSRIPSGFS